MCRFPAPTISTRCGESTVHHGWLYIVAHGKSSGNVVIRTKDKQEWQTLPSPPNTAYCFGILSHNDRLFILSFPPKSVDERQHLIIHELLLEGSDHVEWRPLPNARCPVQRWGPAFFGAGNSLVLAGGQSLAQPWPTTCSEYDLHGNDWVRATNWPDLSESAHGFKAVIARNVVHLIGGLGINRSSNRTTFCIEIKGDRPAGSWLVNALPATPFSQCGACEVYGNLVVAGGSGQSFGDQPDVFVFDGKSKKSWQRLPELTIARRSPSLVFFGGGLLSIGGFQGTAVRFSSAVEELSL